jgi:hypothetical protein
MKKKKTRRAPAAAAPDRSDNFAKAFHALKQILKRYEEKLAANADTREKYYLQTKTPSLNDRPLFFAAVLRGRTHVSFQLAPLFWDPSLAKGMSARLKARRNGQTAFNFTEPEPALFRELAKLTSRGFNLYRRKNLL